MHVQTIPKSPPKIIVQVAISCDFFLTNFQNLDYDILEETSARILATSAPPIDTSKIKGA